jgi:hypothetical protein
MEGSARYKNEEKPTTTLSVKRAGYVEIPATPVVMAHRGKEEKIRKHLDDGDISRSNGTLTVRRRGERSWGGSNVTDFLKAFLGNGSVNTFQSARV